MPDEGGGDTGLRAALLAIEELREDLYRLAGRVRAMEEELVRHVPEAERAGVEAAIEARTPELVKQILAADVGATGRLHLGDPVDKYLVPPIADGGPPCLELLPICHARCCGLDVALTAQDLDEGVLRWDRGNPYLLAQGEDRRCTHLSSSGAGCTCYAQRPAICRQYDCRDDRRIWIDYAQRIPVPLDERRDAPELTAEQRHDAARRRSLSLMVESRSLRGRRGS